MTTTYLLIDFQKLEQVFYLFIVKHTAVVLQTNEFNRCSYINANFISFPIGKDLLICT